MNTTTPDLLVVGAGPAGLAAAVTAATHGARVLVVDEQPRPGGQIWRRPDPGNPGPDPLSAPAYAAGRALLTRAAAHPGIDFAHRTTAWGVFATRTAPDGWAAPPGTPVPAGPRVAVHGPEGVEVLLPRALLLTAGAYDLPVPLPGWTLPGFLTVGGIQALLKGHRTLAGRRIVLAGAHPLLLIAAAQLVRAGADVAEVAFAQHLPAPADLIRAVAALPGNRAKVAEGLAALRTLRRAGVPVHTRTLLLRAEGEQHVTAAVLARVDQDWRPVPGSARTVGCDTVGTGYGFVPSTELARQAGCAAHWNGPAGGWVLDHDDAMRTSLPHIWAAGELTGVAGAEHAVATGRRAGLDIVRSLGLLESAPYDRELRSIEGELAATGRMAAFLDHTCAPHRAGLHALADDDTVLCRCEEITFGEVRRTLADNPGLDTADAVKLITRAGMGPCQGRMCGPALLELLHRETGLPRETIGAFTARPPVKPLPVEALARAHDATTTAESPTDAGPVVR
ncbi:NAD(P)/FAD-dependent oxidoreductase [Embleya sp. MST-111070]|uniref:FAD/NAD(P)-dependent oxidoreductase n=1 Tax=Embleya sp. MST-111070 TaxID=3398231 RepID=UPI003F73F22A